MKIGKSDWSDSNFKLKGIWNSIMGKKIIFNQLEIFLLPQRGVFIPAYGMLIISDFHIGKLGHFRKEGVFVPPMQLDSEFNRLEFLIRETSANCVVFLGDLFHSSWNKEWDIFIEFMSRYTHIKFILTKGNHDIIDPKYLENSPLLVKPYLLLDEGVVLSHEPIPHLGQDLYNIVGHLHPGYQLQAKGRQRYKLPCFVLENKVLTVPAFGKWTGLFLVEQKPHNQIFVIINDSIIAIK